MKKTAKAWLEKAGALGAVQHLYFNAKTASPSVLVREVAYRVGGDDNLPLPPPHLIFDVIACRWAAVYLDSGRLIMDDMRGILARNGFAPESFSAILDFGCGCGRLIRHFHTLHESVEIHGSDYNPALVQWCAENLPFAQFSINMLEPPLAYPDASLDYIYARSVLTHMTEDLQLAWMAELRRVLRSGGVLYVTTHGRPLIGGLSSEQQEAFEAGRLVVTYADVAGTNLCSSYQSRRYMEERLIDGFDLVDFVEGRPITHLRQDVYLLRKR